jgi:hypothetical protein
MTKICAIITKNGTLDEIKELIKPYQNHALSKKIVKTKEEWIDEYKEEIEIKLKKNAIKIEKLNELIKKSKFNKFYEIEKNDLLKINSDLEDALNFFNNKEDLVVKEMKLKKGKFTDKDGNILDYDENYYFKKIYLKLNSPYTKFLTTNCENKVNSCKIKDLIIDFTESEQEPELDFLTNYESIIWDGGVRSENKYLWDSVYVKECFPVNSFLSEKQGLIKDLPEAYFDSIHLILKAIEKENPEYYITLIEYSDEEEKKDIFTELYIR